MFVQPEMMLVLSYKLYGIVFCIYADSFVVVVAVMIFINMRKLVWFDHQGPLGTPGSGFADGLP
jgi:hypothetical protein